MDRRSSWQAGIGSCIPKPGSCRTAAIHTQRVTLSLYKQWEMDRRMDWGREMDTLREGEKSRQIDKHKGRGWWGWGGKRTRQTQAGNLTDSPVDRQTDRKVERDGVGRLTRQTNSGIQTDQWTDRETERWREREEQAGWLDRQTQVYRQINGQTDRKVEVD